MKIYDITRALQDAPIYPGSAPAVFEPVADIETRGWRETLVTAGSHMGTHADAESHFLPDGAPIDAMPLDAYCGDCRVLTVSAEELIRADELRGRIAGAERVVLHTGGKSYLCEQAAEYLAECGVKLVVTDALSVAPPDNEAAVHVILARGGVAVVENAVLDGVEDGEYLIFAFPAKYAGCDAAPARAVLLQSDEE